MKKQKYNFEKIYLTALVILMCCLLLYKYMVYDCILICEDWYDGR